MSNLKEKIAGKIRFNVTMKRSGTGSYIITLNEHESAKQILAIIIAHLEKCPAPRATEEDDALVMKQEMIKALKEG